MESETKSVRSQAVSQTSSVTESQIRRTEEARLHAIKVAEIKKGYVSLFDDEEVKYKTKMIGLNPNMRPTTNASMKKIFPMQGLWPEKNLMKSTRNHFDVSEKDQVEQC